MVSVQVRKQQVAYAVGRGISQRRACTLIDVSRAMLTYEQRMPARDAGPAARMKELSSQYQDTAIDAFRFSWPGTVSR